MKKLLKTVLIIASICAILLVGFLISGILVIQDKYESEAICSVYENSAGKEIYDLHGAACFITLKLNKKRIELHVVRDALIAAENYMTKMGLISESQNSENNNNSNLVLDINELVKYTLNEENIELGENELLDIYNTEIEYLKFIGLVNQ